MIDADKLLKRIDEPLAVTSNPQLDWANKVAHDIMRRMVTDALKEEKIEKQNGGADHG